MSPAAPTAIALRRAAIVLDSLSPVQLADLDAGRGRLVFQPAAFPAAAPARQPEPSRVGIDVSSAVATIRGLTSPAEVASYLRRERFTAAALKAIARTLGPTVSAAARTKAELERDIVAGTAGFRTRAAAMSGGAWS